jgi:nitrite reductase/ring-hydroxylating ferredoxin subunit
MGVYAGAPRGTPERDESAAGLTAVHARTLVAFATKTGQTPIQEPARNVARMQVRKMGSPDCRPAAAKVQKRMAEKFVAKASEFTDGDRRIVFVGDNEIGVFRHEGQFYAYSNFCLHQGGPACEGLTIAKVEERLRPDKTSQGLYFSETEMHFVCPWHGMEYDMKTGECVSDRKMKLKKYKILQKGDEVYVVA